MLAEVAHAESFPALGQEFCDGIASSFPEFESFNLFQAPWSQVKKFLFFPGFLDDYTEMVADLFSSGAFRRMPYDFVLERVAILTCLRIFCCPVDDLSGLLHTIFNELLFLRISVRGISATPASTAPTIPIDHRVINQVELFSRPWHPLLPSIRLLLE